MPANADLAEIAALPADPTRATMLQALMDGRALTAKELATAAGVTQQTASGHLSRMTEAGLLAVTPQGRHRYYRLASQTVAHMLESILQVAADSAPRRPATGPRDAQMRQARTCYNHFAGRLGVAITDALTAQGHLELTHDAGLLTDSGQALLTRAGIDLAPHRTGRTNRVLCRPCLDWSERRPHLAGAAGTAICAHALNQGWVQRINNTRAVLITPEGKRAFKQAFGADL
jgi:hypothetical protein